MATDVKKIFDQINDMTVLEAVELKKMMEEEWDVSAAAPVVISAPGVAPAGVPAGDGDAAEEQTAFDVVLESVGDKKIQVIKEIRAVTTLGLKEAKELVDGAPNTVKEGVDKQEAESVKAKLEEAGATVQLK